MLQKELIGIFCNLNNIYFFADAIIGSVTHQLKDLDMPYTAVYTGKSSNIVSFNLVSVNFEY